MTEKELVKNIADWKALKSSWSKEDYLEVSICADPVSFPCIAILTPVDRKRGDLDLVSYYNVETFVYPEDFSQEI